MDTIEAARRDERMQMTLELLQAGQKQTTEAIEKLTAKIESDYKQVLFALEAHKIETEKQTEEDFKKIRNQIGQLGERLDPIEKSYMRMEKAEQEANQRVKENIEHGKRVAIGAIVTAVLAGIGTAIVWIVKLVQSNPNPGG
jgi:uncharacterized protein with gpF-like domain